MHTHAQASDVGLHTCVCTQKHQGDTVVNVLPHVLCTGGSDRHLVDTAGPSWIL